MCLNKLVRVYSAIQPSGQIHVGNYCGAIKQWLSLQKTSNLIIAIADLHGLTSLNKSSNYKNNILETAASLIACGISPQECILYQQSAVSQHLELYWILSTVVNLSRLTGMSHYKEKSKRLTPTLALCGYPLLMASDILLYNPQVVPVGEDQRQHVELVGYVSRAFNETFNCNLFNCDVSIGKYSFVPKIKSLRDPHAKMSKSTKNPKDTLNIFEEPSSIKNKIKSSLTDSMSNYISYERELRPGLANLIDIYSCVVDRSPEEIVEEFEGRNIVEFKERMIEEVVEVWKPLRVRFDYLMGQKEYLEEVLMFGNGRACEIAEHTMKTVKCCVGN